MQAASQFREQKNINHLIIILRTHVERISTVQEKQVQAQISKKGNQDFADALALII